MLITNAVRESQGAGICQWGLRAMGLDTHNGVKFMSTNQPTCGTESKLEIMESQSLVNWRDDDNNRKSPDNKSVQRVKAP